MPDRESKWRRSWLSEQGPNAIHHVRRELLAELSTWSGLQFSFLDDPGVLCHDEEWMIGFGVIAQTASGPLDLSWAGRIDATDHRDDGVMQYDATLFLFAGQERCVPKYRWIEHSHDGLSGVWVDRGWFDDEEDQWLTVRQLSDLRCPTA